MSTVGDVKNLTLNKMREFSNGGELITTSDNKDYLLSLIPLINLYQKEICVSTHKIDRKYPVVINNPTNLLGDFLEDLVHTGAEDKMYEVEGGLTYSFQVKGTYTVYVEEETATDVWTVLDTLTGVPTDGVGYSVISGFVLASDADNNVRLRFSGAYRYPFRYPAFFGDSFATVAEIPIYLPHVPTDMDEDFYLIKRIDSVVANQQYVDYSDYRMEKYDKNRKRIYFPYGVKGQFNIHYYAYPATIPEASEANPDENNAIELDIAEEAIPALVHRIASTLLKDENPYMADSFEEDYTVAKSEVDRQNDMDQGIQTFVDNTGGW